MHLVNSPLARLPRYQTLRWPDWCYLVTKTIFDEAQLLDFIIAASFGQNVEIRPIDSKLFLLFPLQIHF
jgi:hypothetical protein